MRHSIALLLVLLLAVAGRPALAAEVLLIGTFGSSAAILSIDGSAPKTVKVGQRAGAVMLISVDKDQATVEIDGKRRVLQRGQTYSSSAASGAQSVTLAVGAGGHFMEIGRAHV